jgi:hypothetical protein
MHAIKRRRDIVFNLFYRYYVDREAGIHGRQPFED